jgi:hypothetical protein
MAAYAAGAADARPRTKIPLESAPAYPLFFLRSERGKIGIAKILPIAMSCPKKHICGEIIRVRLASQTIMLYVTR